VKQWFPKVTFTLFVLTAVPSLIGLATPAFEVALRRDPTLIAQGGWYRLVTSLVTQDGGALGCASNLIFLMALGILAERRLGGWRTLALYLSGAAVGQAAGCLFGTVGAGNSIANLGLAGGLVAAFARGRAWRIDATVGTFFILLVSLDGLSSDTARTIGFVVVVVVVVAVMAGGQLVARRELVSRWVFLAIAAGVGAWLTAVSNLHGPALLAGLALGAAITGAVVVEPEPRAGDA
jgi:membrane associated rhomboid family serine protease